jgi:hypothetical protein
MKRTVVDDAGVIKYKGEIWNTREACIGLDGSVDLAKHDGPMLIHDRINLGATIHWVRVRKVRVRVRVRVR